MNANTPHNLDSASVAGFEQQAGEWWDPAGPWRALHAINPVRTRYVEQCAGLEGRFVLDVGCGGGLLCESMAKRGARVTGIDAGSAAIEVATAHARGEGLDIEYETGTLDDFAARDERRFQVVTCMELLEHVPDPARLVAGLAARVEPGGHLVLSTINRTLNAWLGVVVGAEYLLNLVPRGTHHYEQFIRPAELSSWLRAAGCEVLDVAGMRYLPWLNRCSLNNSPAANYLIHARRKG